MSKLNNFWENSVPKGHKHFIDFMDSDKIKRLNTRVKNNLIGKLNTSEIKTSYDWGCGGGLHSKTLKEFSNVTPLDISQESLDKCESYMGVKGKLIPNDLEGFTLEKVDLLFCVDVIHHFPSLDYFNSVCEVWNDISPNYLCLQFKVENDVKDNTDYFDKSNYIHSLFLTKNYIMDKFNKYNQISYSEEPSKLGNITHGFLILKINNLL